MPSAATIHSLNLDYTKRIRDVNTFRYRQDVDSRQTPLTKLVSYRNIKTMRLQR